jgi:hydroxymethylpyrimidine/phosphomethylpyrimidine kinase
MLASAESIEVVADAFRQYNVTTSVVDPVRSPNLDYNSTAPLNSYAQRYG